jgi:hypothetical protein
VGGQAAQREAARRVGKKEANMERDGERQRIQRERRDRDRVCETPDTPLSCSKAGWEDRQRNERLRGGLGKERQTERDRETERQRHYKTSDTPLSCSKAGWEDRQRNERLRGGLEKANDHRVASRSDGLPRYRSIDALVSGCACLLKGGRRRKESERENRERHKVTKRDVY